jgi:hypothetical protein
MGEQDQPPSTADTVGEKKANKSDERKPKP